MAPDEKAPTQESQPVPEAAEHVAEAKAHLTALREQLDKYPDLEAAIERLEMALSILTTRTGGML